MISSVSFSTRLISFAFGSLCGSAVYSPSMSDSRISRSALTVVATTALSVSLSPMTISSVVTVSFSLMTGSAPSSSSRNSVFWMLCRRSSWSMSLLVSRICATVWLYSENSLS